MDPNNKGKIMNNQPPILTWKDPRMRQIARDSWRRFKKDNHPCEMGPEIENLMLNCIAIKTFMNGKTLFDHEIYDIMLRGFTETREDLQRELEDLKEQKGSINW